MPPQLLLKFVGDATDMPAGKGSTTATPVSETGLVAGLEIVNVSFVGFPASIGLVVKAFAMTGEIKTAVTSVSELFPVLPASSPPPDTVAVLLTLGTAPARTLTGTEIAGSETFCAIVVADVQLIPVFPATLLPAPP